MLHPRKTYFPHASFDEWLACERSWSGRDEFLHLYVERNGAVINLLGWGFLPAVRTDLNQREKSHTNNRAHKTAPAHSGERRFFSANVLTSAAWEMDAPLHSKRPCLWVRQRWTHIHSHLCRLWQWFDYETINWLWFHSVPFFYVKLLFQTGGMYL